MLNEELLQLVKQVQKDQCETNILKLKSAAQGCPKKLYDTLSSFSNQDEGGTILFGIDESNFEVCGVYDANDLQKKVNAKCKEMVPNVRAHMRIVRLSLQKFLELIIRKGLYIIPGKEFPKVHISGAATVMSR